MDDQLRILAHRAAGPTTTRRPDLGGIARRVRRRRVGQQVVATAVLAAVAYGVSLRSEQPASFDVVDVGLDTSGLRMVDLDDQALPTLLPFGYDRCVPTSQDATGVIVTEFCSTTGELTLLVGGHDDLPEAGTTFAMGPRTGYADVTDDGEGIQVTVSDATRADDTHYRLTSTDPDIVRGNLAAIIASIPSYANELSTP